MRMYRIFTINPGSTSTKIAYFVGEEKVFQSNIQHDAASLSVCKEIRDQLPVRLSAIMEALDKEGLSLDGTDAFVGRGGSLVPLEGGTYEVTDLLFHHAEICMTIKHPGALGAQIARKLADEYHGRAFVVNPEDTDELDDIARITGVKGAYRKSHVHVLNQKEVAIQFANECGKKYEDLRLVIAHMGGGITVSAHRDGRIVDSDDAVEGDGPMAPTRCGHLSVDMVRHLIAEHGDAGVAKIVLKNGGLQNHLGTTDAREVENRISKGDVYAKLVYDAMLYQIAKEIGAYAAVLDGQVDTIILTGGMAHSPYVVHFLKKKVSWIAPVKVVAGELEMEALAHGAMRVLNGEETVKEYTGKPVFSGFWTDMGGTNGIT